jgi:hypothetical protein
MLGSKAMKNKLLAAVSLFLLVVSTACGFLPGLTAAPTATPTPFIYVEGEPREGQPPFPVLGRYWVIDKGCNFSEDKMKIADAAFEKLRTDGIAEVAVICQAGVVDKGATNDEKIWLRDWARQAKMGEKDVNRAVVWLIRPDAKPEEQTVTLEISRWLFWYTAIEYSAALKEAANYVNWKDYDGALVSITRNVDGRLRALWKTHQGEGGAAE